MRILCRNCPESRIDSARVRNFFSENGWNIISDARKADLIIFWACAFTEASEAESLRIIRWINAQKKRDARLIVWGCLPEINPQALKLEYDGITFGEREIEMFNFIAEARKPIQAIRANFLHPVVWRHSLERSLPSRIYNFIGECLEKGGPLGPPKFQIKIATGCLGHCTYCAIRKSRGLIRSKSIEEILSEFKDGLRRGFKYFNLRATDLGAYGRDQGHTLVDLLDEMTKETGDYKIGMRNVNPCYLIEMFEELQAIFSSGKIWLLSSAVESGSNRILELMGRKYKIEDFKKCIQTLNKEYPNIFLRTQIMVGFPTETGQDYEKSMQLFDELIFDWVEVFKFSKRLGTVAATMNGQVPEEIRNLRFRKMLVKSLLRHPFRKIDKLLRFM